MISVGYIKLLQKIGDKPYYIIHFIYQLLIHINYGQKTNYRRPD